MAFPDALCEVMEMPLAADYRDIDLHKEKVDKPSVSILLLLVSIIIG